MAKSARASGIKKNKTALRKKVFDPVETARNERLSSKLLELARQEKPLRKEMDVEQEDEPKDAQEEVKENDIDMDVDAGAAAAKKSSKFRLERNEKQKQHKASRIQKGSRHKKPRNQIVFAKTGRAKSKSKR